MFTAKPSSSLSSCCELKTTSKTSGEASFCGSFFPSGTLASFHLDCETCSLFYIFFLLHFLVMFCYCMVLQMQKLISLYAESPEARTVFPVQAWSKPDWICMLHILTGIVAFKCLPSWLIYFIFSQHSTNLN